MSSWERDADAIDIGDINTTTLHRHIVSNYAIREFLTAGRDDKKRFIVAPKGLGKTLLLKVKSQIYRNETSGYAFIPETQLVEKFTKHRHELSNEAVNKYSNLAAWERLWELAMLATILRSLNVPMPKDVEDTIGDASRLPDIIAVLLEHRGTVEKLYRLVPSHLRPKVRDLRHHASATQVAMFVDNIDEAFEDHTGYPLRASSSGFASDVWINAQLGALTVARDICNANQHIRIFISSRTEALHSYRGATDLQLNALMTQVNYTKQEIRAIFEQNIKQTEEDQLTAPEDPDQVRRLLGFSELPHRFALDDNMQPRMENVFDYMYRHTFGRPRDIVTVGREISLIPRRERTVRTICETVNRVSHELLEQYKKEVIPYFEDDVYKAVLSGVRSNVVGKSAAKEVADSIADTLGFSGAFSYLWRLGIVGVAAHETPNSAELVQRFQPAGRYHAHSDHEIPDHPDYFLLHPSVDMDLRSRHGANFYNKSNIIGNDYTFEIKREYSRRPLHVHFGLERDSLSLMLPLLSKTKRLAVIREESDMGAELGRATKASIHTSLNEDIEFDVVRDAMSPAGIDIAFQRWIAGECNLLIYTSDHTLAARALDACETLSTLSYSDFLQRALLARPHPPRRTYFYLCQRYIKERNETTQWQRRIDEAGLTNITLVPTLIDRLCYSYAGKLAGDVFTFDVVPEEHGQLICIDRPGGSMRPNKIIVRPKTNQAFQYYSCRQKLIVEGIYRLGKVVRAKSYSEKTGLLDDVYGLFYGIQVQRLLNQVPEGVVMSALEVASKSERDAQLRQFCVQQRARFDSLGKKDPTQGIAGYINVSKRGGFFPRDDELYRLVRELPEFLSSTAVLGLMNLLEVGNRKDMASVFISYSFRDARFARKMHDALVKRGIKVFLFQKDDPNRPMEAIMIEEIQNHDRVMFIASSSSIKSGACQFELSTTRKKIGAEMENLFIAVRLDDYVLSVRRDQIAIPEKRDEYWANIQLLRETNIQDFRDYDNEQASHAFEEKIDRIVEDRIIRAQKQRRERASKPRERR